MCIGLNPRPASKACFLTVMTFLPAALPLLRGCPCCFHAAVSRAISLQPALRTPCFLASPPSQRGTEPPAWQRPGSRTRVVGPGAWSVQNCWCGGPRAQVPPWGPLAESPPAASPEKGGFHPAVLALPRCPETRGSEPGVGTSFPARGPPPAPTQGKATCRAAKWCQHPPT